MVLAIIFYCHKMLSIDNGRLLIVVTEHCMFCAICWQTFPRDTIS